MWTIWLLSRRTNQLYITYGGMSVLIGPYRTPMETMIGIVQFSPNIEFLHLLYIHLLYYIPGKSVLEI